MPTFLNPYSSKPELLGHCPIVRHVMLDGALITIEFGEDRITITDSSPDARRMIIEPVLSNTIRVRSVSR